jgi:hypothetical protein
MRDVYFKALFKSRSNRFALSAVGRSEPRHPRAVTLTETGADHLMRIEPMLAVL